MELAELHFAAGRPLEALKILDSDVSTAAPLQETGAENLRGQCLIALGRHQDGIKSYRKVIRIMETQPDFDFGELSEVGLDPTVQPAFPSVSHG